MSLRRAQAEDAGSGDGDAAAAAAAAAAVAESAAKVLREQASQALPVREDYFLGDDAAASPGGAGAGRAVADMLCKGGCHVRGDHMRMSAWPGGCVGTASTAAVCHALHQSVLTHCTCRPGADADEARASADEERSGSGADAGPSGSDASDDDDPDDARVSSW